MQNKPATFQSNLPAPPEQEVERSTWSGSRCWRVEVSYNHHVFLNKHEKDYFLQELAKGKKLVKVGEMLLSSKIIAITKVR